MQLIEGQDMRVEAQLTSSRGMLVVTFTGRDHSPPASGGAGQGFMTKNGISAVHFISKANHWWQTQELAAGLDAVRALADRERFESVVTYGSSMGGYGAMIASGRLRADRMVVSVPQFSIDPEKVPWEKRWLKDARKIDFSDEDFEDQVGSGEIIIFSDPHCLLDQMHVDLIQSCRPTRQIGVPFAGHDVSRILAECDLLGEATLDALHGRIDEREFKRRMRSKRSHSPLVLGGASRLMHSRNKHVLGDKLGARAFSMLLASPPARMRPEHSRLVQGRVTALIDLGRPAAALEVLDQWAKVAHGEDRSLGRLRELVALGIEGQVSALESNLIALRNGKIERAALNEVSDLLNQYAEPTRVKEIYEEYGRYFLKADSTARRLIKVLLSKGLGREAEALADLAADRFPAKAASFRDFSSRR